MSVEQHFDKTCENIVDSCNSQSNVDFMGIAQNNNSISSLRSGSFERMEENDSFVINSSAKENNEHVAEKTKTVGNRDNCSAQRNHWKHDTVQQAPNCNELSDSSLRSLALHKTDSLESTESSPNDSNGEISPTFENILPNLTFIDNQCFKTVAASFKSNSASTVLLKSAVDKVSPSENSDKTISKKILKSKVPDVVMDATKFLHDLITSTYAQYKKTVLGSPQINNLQRMKPCSVETSSTGDIPLPSSALSSLESDPKTAIPPLPSSSPLRLSLPKNTPFRPLLPKDTPVRPLPKDTPVRAPLPQVSPVWPPLPKDTPVSPPLPQDFPVRPPLPKDSPVRPPFPNDPPFCTENNANTDGFVNLPKYSAVGIMKSCNSTSNLISSSTTSPRAFQEEGQCKPTQTTNNLCVSPSSQKYSDDKMDLSPISPSLKSCIEVFQSEKPLQIAASESQRSQAPMSTSHFSTSLLTNNFNHPPPTLPNRWGPPPSLTVQNGYCNGREIRAPCSLPMNFNTLNSDVNRTPQFRQPISLNNTGFPNSHVPTTSWHHGPPTPTWQLPFCYPNSNSQCPPFPLPHFSIPVYSNQTHLGHNNAVRPSLPTAINNTIHVSSSSAIPNVTVMSGVHVPPNASSQNFSTTFERCNSRDEKNVVRPFEENRILRTDNEIHKSSNSLSCTSVIDNSKSNVANSLVIEKSDKIGHKGETQKQLSDRMSDIPHSYNMPSSSLTGTSSSCIGRSVDHVPTTDRALSKESDKLVGCDRRSSFLSKPTVNCPLSSLSEQIDVTLMKDHHVQHCQPNVLMSSKCSSTPAPQVPLTNLSCKAHGGKNPLKSNIYPSLKHNPTLIISNNSTCVLPEKGEQGLPNMNGKKRKLSNIQKCSDRQSQIVSKSVPAISSKPLSKQHGNCQVKVIHRQQKGKNTSLNKPGHNANISKSFVGSNNSSISEGCVMSNTVKSDKIEDQACNKVLGKHNLSVGVSNCSITDTCSKQSKEMHANSTSPNVETNEVSNERSKENKYDNLDGPVTKPSQKSNILLGKSQISQDALNSAVGVPGSLSSSKNGEPSLKARTNTNVGIQISTGVTGSLISTLGVPGSSLKEICEESSLQMNTASAQSHKSRITDIDHTNKVSKKSSNSLPGMSDRCTAASNSVNVPQEKYGKVNINDSGQHIETRITSYVRCPSHCGKVTERTLLPVNTTPINCQGISPQDVSSTELNVVKLNSDVSHSCLSSPTEKHSGNAELEIAANKQRSSTERVDNFSTVCRLNSSCQETSQNVGQVSRESININQCSENMVTPLVELLHSNVQSKYVSDSFSSSKQKTCINDGLNVKEIRLYDETISAGVPRMLNNQITSNDCLMSTGNKTDFINIKSNVTSADDRIRSPINNLRSPESLPQLSNGTDKENSLSITQTMKNRIKMEPTDVLHDDSQQEFRMESNSSHINDNTGISKRKLNFQGSLDMQRQIRSTSLEQVTCSQLRSPARNCFTVCANNGIVEKQPENNGTNEIRIKEEIIDNENDGTNMTVCSNQGVNTDDSTWYVKHFILY